MNSGIAAALLLLFAVLSNIMTYVFFLESHRRVQLRRPPVSRRLLLGLVLAGGGVGALIAFANLWGARLSRGERLVLVIGLEAAIWIALLIHALAARELTVLRHV